MEFLRWSEVEFFNLDLFWVLFLPELLWFCVLYHERLLLDNVFLVPGDTNCLPNCDGVLLVIVWCFLSGFLLVSVSVNDCFGVLLYKCTIVLVSK